MIDRIVHHAKVFALKGASYRLRGRELETLPSVTLTADAEQGRFNSSVHFSPGESVQFSSVTDSNSQYHRTMVSNAHSSCGVCSTDLSSAEPQVAQEMMMGTHEQFHYALCPGCACLQLIDPPEHLGAYYSGYYGRSPLSLTSLKFRLLMWRFRAALGRSINPIGVLLNRYFPEPAITSITKVVGPSESVLDVGCANGELLLLLKAFGYESVRGCDPFIDATLHYDNGVTVANHTLEAEIGPFDVIMANHSLEHVGDQHAFVRQAFDRLVPNGRIVIRIPTSSSWAYDRFGVKWYQLDAPRHLYVHSRQSITQLLEAAGFVNVEISDDSTIWQIVSSELYEAGIPFSSHQRWYLKRLPKFVASGKFKRLKDMTAELNAFNRGDQICVTATRPPSSSPQAE